jgi:hypothetical protein
VNTLVSAIVIGLLVSCTTLQNYRLYEGPQFPEDRIAYLVSKGPIRVHSVDGRKNPNGEETYGPSRLEVLPGNHTLNVSFYHVSVTTKLEGSYYYDIFFENSSKSNVDVDLKTEAGNEYLLTSDYDFKSLQWNLVVINKTNDEKTLETGPYPLNRVRTGDDKQIRRLYLRGR